MGKAGGKRAAGQDMLDADFFLAIVEEDEIAGHHIDRADREMHVAGIEQLEIHQLFQRLASRACCHRSWWRPWRRAAGTRD